MQKKPEHLSRGPDADKSGSRITLTRREVLAGAAAAALVAGAPAALAAPAPRARNGSQKLRATTSILRRYMAAAAPLGNGRFLVTGGYSRPWKDGVFPPALDSAMIYDSSRGQWLVAAPMSIPRARHAAVALADGRVAVLGGISMNPTDSVEIYDPITNSWTSAAPLSQPRYDHAAAQSDGQVLIVGGSSNTMLSSHETYDPNAVVKSTPNGRSN